MSEAYTKQKSDDNCCICFPIGTGMKLMAFLSIVHAVFSVVLGAMAVKAAPIPAIIMLGVSLPLIIISIKWIQWLRTDEHKTRQDITKWMQIGILVTFTFCLAHLCQAILAKWSIVESIISGCLNIYLSFYFFTVTKRYQDKMFGTDWSRKIFMIFIEKDTYKYCNSIWLNLYFKI